MSTDKNSESFGPDPLDTADLGYETEWCSFCGVERYHHYRWVPFHIEVTCEVCGKVHTT